MIFVKMAVLGTLLFVVLLVSVPPPSVSSHLERCKDGEGKPHHYDYSQDCISESVRCGSFCFWAECLECKPWTHTHSCGENCSYSHTGHKFPCIKWYWHIFDPDAPKNIGDNRHDEFDAPDLITLLEPGGGPDDLDSPDSVCIADGNEREVLPGREELSLADPLLGPPIPVIPSGVVPIPVTPSGVDPLQATDYSLSLPLSGLRGKPYNASGFTADRPGRIIPLNYGNLENSDPADVTISDLSHLPRTPGDPGALVLSSLKKVTDNSVTLQVSGLAAGSTAQYRYWSYYGLRDPSEDGLRLLEVAPTEFRVPFVALAGPVVIDPALRGIFSFQVRSVGADGVSTGNSNIRHEMIGMAGFHTISPPLIPQPFILSLPMVVPLPTIQPPSFYLPKVVPNRGTPLPPLEEGLTRPIRPSIQGARQVSGVSTVELTLAGSYSDTVKYRWWPHSGVLPTVAFEEWLPAPVSGGSFRISGVKPDTPVVDEDWPSAPGFEPVVNGRWPSVSLFNFQVRLEDAAGIPGEPSDVKMLFVWGGDYPGSAPGLLVGTPYIDFQSEFPHQQLPGVPDGIFCYESAGLSSDCSVLMAFAGQLLHPTSSVLNWNGGWPVDLWTGVTVGGSPPRVQRLDLHDKGLVGTIPWSMGNLSALRSLELQDNELVAHVPASLGRLRHLVTLDFRNNRLVGSIPKEWSDLRGLKTLRLDGNSLTGTLTGGQLDGMVSLTSLGVADNKFYGSVPPVLVGFGLDFVRFGGNDFTGCLPLALLNVPNNDLGTLEGVSRC